LLDGSYALAVEQHGDVFAHGCVDHVDETTAANSINKW